MLASASTSLRRPHKTLRLPFLFPYHYGLQARGYTQQKTARVPNAAPQRTTTKPSPASQVKNRTTPPAHSDHPIPSKAPAGLTPPPSLSTREGNKLRDEWEEVRQAQLAKEMEESGQQLEMVRRAVAAGVDPWGTKVALMDLTLPSKSLRENWHNTVQNVISMYRLASEFAFPAVLSKWRIHPQLMKAQSTDDNAWIAGYRKQLLGLYEAVNTAIAQGDRKTLNGLTAYEYQAYATDLLKKNETRTRPRQLTTTWELSSIVSPVKVLSLRAFPLYTAAEEPKFGNRLCVQALVRFETMQRMVLKDARGRVVTPSGADAKEAEPRRVLEYLICENKMFYKDGWYIRDQVFEGVKPRFKDIGAL